MNMKYILISVMLGLPFSLKAVEPSIIELSKLSFAEVLHFIGSCEMDYDTAAVVDLPGSKTCMFSASGTVGKYRIFSNPNSTVSIRVNQKLNTGDGVRFVPKGRITTSDISFEISSNFNYQVNSGTSGVVDLFIGGRLYIESDLNPNTSYELDIPDGLDWSVSP